MNPYMIGAWLRARLHLGERDQKGANLVEYILLIVFIALVVVAAVKVLQGGVSAKFEDAKACLDKNCPAP